MTLWYVILRVVERNDLHEAALATMEKEHSTLNSLHRMWALRYSRQAELSVKFE